MLGGGGVIWSLPFKSQLMPSDLPKLTRADEVA
jgi:hypothetical protein